MSEPELRVQESLARYRGDPGSGTHPAGRDHVVVALAGGPESATLLGRAARLATRTGARLEAVHVSPPGPDDDLPPATLVRLRALAHDAGGTLRTVVAEDVAEAVLDLARGLQATTLVVGVRRLAAWRLPFRASVSDRILAASRDIDVLMVTTHPSARGFPLTGRPSATKALGRARVISGWVLALTTPFLVSLALLSRREAHATAFEALAFIAGTVLCALVGGIWPALTAALVSSLLLNFYFTPPHDALDVSSTEGVTAMLLFLLVAVSVASVVGTAARRTVQATLARRESDTLSLLNQTLLRGDHNMAALLDLVRDTFAMTSAALLGRDNTPGAANAWEVLASTGPYPARTPEEADASAEASESTRLVLRGRPLAAHDMRVLSAFATHLAVVADRERLTVQTAAARRLEEGNRLRTALLAAVSHDLRTPLAGIKAAVSTLRTPGVTWSRDDEADLLAAIEESADRLAIIIANLLDLTRLQTGSVHLVSRDVGLDDVVARTVGSLPESDRIDLDVAADLPAVRVDIGLLDRVTANLLENALRYSPSPARVEVNAESTGTHVLLRVVDHGPGLTSTDKEHLFKPFKRLGDAPAGDGVGLGLAVAAGLTRALGGRLTAHDTAGGGLTMVVHLPVATEDVALAEAPVTADTGSAGVADVPMTKQP